LKRGEEEYGVEYKIDGALRGIHGNVTNGQPLENDLGHCRRHTRDQRTLPMLKSGSGSLEVEDEINRRKNDGSDIGDPNSIKVLR
jgi:hypothetical protein